MSSYRFMRRFELRPIHKVGVRSRFVLGVSHMPSGLPGLSLYMLVSEGSLTPLVWRDFLEREIRSSGDLLPV